MIYISDLGWQHFSHIPQCLIFNYAGLPSTYTILSLFICAFAIISYKQFLYKIYGFQRINLL